MTEESTTGKIFIGGRFSWTKLELYQVLNSLYVYQKVGFYNLCRGSTKNVYWHIPCEKFEENRTLITHLRELLVTFICWAKLVKTLTFCGLFQEWVDNIVHSGSLPMPKYYDVPSLKYIYENVLYDLYSIDDFDFLIGNYLKCCGVIPEAVDSYILYPILCSKKSK